MTRVQFLNDLYHHLYGMTKEQVEQHLTYYAEMLADRMEEGMSEEEAVAGMEDVETIARRILEEEGLPYTPPDQRPVTPPAYPDASRLGGGGGGARAYQVPKRFGWRKALHISVWSIALAIAVFAVIGAVGRWRWNQYAGSYATESIPIPGWEAASDAPVEDTGWDDMYYLEAPYGEGFEYTEGDTQIDVSDVNTIDIQWSAGVVCVQSWNESNIMIQEYAQSELDIATASAAVQMTGLEADTLRAASISGDITVTDCCAQTSDFSSTSGMLILQTLESDQVEASTTSGDICGNLWFDSARISSTSGDIDFTATDTTGSLAARTVSGDIRIWTDSSPLQRVTLGSTSGNITLSLPLYEQGFTLDFKTVSGDLTVPDSTSRPSSKNGTYIYEGGGCEIEAETVSGNLEVY